MQLIAGVIHIQAHRPKLPFRLATFDLRTLWPSFPHTGAFRRGQGAQRLVPWDKPLPENGRPVRQIEHQQF